MTKSQQTSQSSTDYFGEEDSQFLRALETIVLPGDKSPSPPIQPLNQITYIEDESEDEPPPPPAQPGLKRRYSDLESEHKAQDGDIYGASHFGQFGEYMRRKRAKLQIQNKDLENNAAVEISAGIFNGISIYINGWTRPSVQELRKLIVENGGVFQPYLDKKSIVTHIVTCSLTPAKIREFKNMKIVRPEWLTGSVSAGVLLPWTNFAFKPNERVESSQGQSPKQQTITSSAMSRPTSSSLKKKDKVSSNFLDLPPAPSISKTSSSHQTDPLNVTDPGTESDARRVPGYASSTSNPNAQRVMANPEWRKAHTSISSDFIEGYYKNSRLHHLSTWKSELRALVMEAQERAESRMSSTPDAAVPKPISNNVSMRGELLKTRTSPRKWKGKGKADTVGTNERVIMHCDFDCFFVSAGLVSRPELKGKPVVVCHSQGAQGGESSTSEIASCSYEARDFGIRNGMSLQQARKLCPSVLTIPYEFEKYKEFSLRFYTVLMSFADDLQAVSVDEALIEATDAVRARAEILNQEFGVDHTEDPAKVVAEAIRDAVRDATGCEVSIGISHNILLARLATRWAKPAKSYHLFLDELPTFIAPLEISDLHGFGYNTKQKVLEKLGTSKLGDLADKSKSVLCDALGKTMGETLYNAMRGIDEKQLESCKERKSVSCEINYGIRFENNDQAEKFIYQMAEEVKRRLDEVKMLGRMITLKIMKRDPSAPVEPPKFLGHGKCETYNKQAKLVGFGDNAVSDDKLIGEHAWRLLKSFDFDPKELRGIGIQIQKLEPLKNAPTSGQNIQSVLPFKKGTSSASGTYKADPTSMAADSGADVETQPSPRPISPIPLANVTDITTTKPDYVSLPSFSQVDMTVFEALPKELREELETEYRRRSRSTSVANAGPSRAVVPNVLSHRQPSHPFRQTSYPLRNAVPNPRSRILPTKPGFGKGNNLKHGRITQQLAPRHGVSIYANKALLRALGLDKPKRPPVRVTEAELKNLKIDPEVFAMLPVKVQREQLVRARIIEKDGVIPDGPTQRKVLKPSKPFISPRRRRRRGPGPNAVYVQPPVLRQQGKEKKEKLCYFETDDIQTVIEKWVTSYKHWAPKDKDIEFFSKYLVQCMESREGDTGVERAVAIIKWWLILLRRIWANFENESGQTEQMDPQERAATAWWRAFREVKKRLDEVAKKRFGGKLSLK